MPVQSITIRAWLSDGTPVEHVKPQYWCEVCGGPASYGFSILDSNKPRRKWFCRAHRNQGESLMNGENG